ncbi:uncharacterized protein LOC131023289 [Salvia miltiorrhiza]|uniref:uncharacterized protein LOC131023289 n=1 Tax=Salvia miltiorrhiza TaxID=226208 RepID=UPI0025ABF32A|nr:uncharacterized protein LOC131023289 [Salvia miltiorrhiza]
MPGEVSDIERKLEAPMPWIGMYVAVASLICALAMAADTIHGFRGKKHWFPSKIFSLNATSLTLLAVAMKLPVDLTTRMYAATDRLAKICSLAFMSTAMANFMTSLGSMDDRDILMNVTALAILVVTVVVNFCVQVIQMRQFLAGRKMFAEEITAAAFMLLSLLMVISSAVMAPATKHYLESKYHEMMKMASDEQILDSMEEGDFLFDKLRNMIKKYWVMAETSSPQFVIARSVTCTASGIVSMLTALLLAQAEIRLVMEYKGIDAATSLYGWSTKWIVLAQSFGVAVGAVAPAIRCFNAIKFKCSGNGKRGFRDEFKIDAYWTQMMVEWRESSLPMQIRDRKWRKFLHKTKGLILSFLVRVQILIVLCSTAVRYMFFCIATPVISCFHCLERLKSIFSSSKSQVHGISESQAEIQTEIDLSRYVLLLEGEAELPQKIQVDICKEVDKLVRTGKKQQPKNLLSLLHRVGNFKGLKEVDKNQVPSLHSQEPHKCWSLPLVTLTSIAIALPNIPKKDVSWLLRSVDEGLFYVKLIEKTLDKKGNLANSRNAADVIWVGVELYRKWQDNDLHETSLKGRSSKETLQDLSSQAEKAIVNFKRQVRDFVMENPLNWPVKAIAANSMYRICQRLLKAYEGDYLQADERLFEQLINMIANILAASLTNLMRVVIIKCHQRDIKKKEKNVREAALLLGETEEILQVLQQHRATARSDPDESEFIEKWCNLLIKRKV